jgi:hypothetical protein
MEERDRDTSFLLFPQNYKGLVLSGVYWSNSNYFYCPGRELNSHIYIFRIAL